MTFTGTSYAGLQVLFPVESLVDGVSAVEDGFTRTGIEVDVHADAEQAACVNDDQVSFFHDFELLNGDSSGLVTIQEFGFGFSARSNYRKASIRHAPQGEAARSAGMGDACA